MGSIPATLVILFNSKYEPYLNLSKKTFNTPNTLIDINFSNEANPSLGSPTSFDTTQKQKFSPNKFSYKSPKNNGLRFLETESKTRRSIKGLHTYTFPYFVKESNLIQQVQGRFMTVKRLYSYGKLNHRDLSTFRNKSSKPNFSHVSNKLATFWKKKYPLSIRVSGPGGKVVLTKKLGKSQSPDRKFFLRLGFNKLKTPLLGKKLLSNKSVLNPLDFDDEVGFFKRKSLKPLSSFDNLLNRTHITFLPTYLVFDEEFRRFSNSRQNYNFMDSKFRSPIIESIFKNTFMFTNNLTFKAFFFRNSDLQLNLLRRSLLQTPIFYQKHFFTSNRSNLISNDSSRNFVSPVMGGNSLESFRLPQAKSPLKYYSNVLAILKRYYNFIEFSRVLSQ